MPFVVKRIQKPHKTIKSIFFVAKELQMFPRSGEYIVNRVLIRLREKLSNPIKVNKNDI